MPSPLVTRFLFFNYALNLVLNHVIRDNIVLDIINYCFTSNIHNLWLTDLTIFAVHATVPLILLGICLSLNCGMNWPLSLTQSRNC